MNTGVEGMRGGCVASKEQMLFVESRYAWVVTDFGMETSTRHCIQIPHTSIAKSTSTVSFSSILILFYSRQMRVAILLLFLLVFVLETPRRLKTKHGDDAPHRNVMRHLAPSVLFHSLAQYLLYKVPDEHVILVLMAR